MPTALRKKVKALCGARPSGGTIMLNLYLASHCLGGFERQLKAALVGQAVLNADETGSKLNGKLNWLHSVSNAHFTLYGQHEKRGYAAILNMGVLPRFQGVVVHDAWNSYFQLPGEHALCNAHLLRELRRLEEQDAQGWAGELRAALQGVSHQRKTGTLMETDKAAFYERFGVLLVQGLEANPGAPPIPGQRGRPKQHRGRNLALRCQQHRIAVLLFLERDDVPFATTRRAGPGGAVLPKTPNGIFGFSASSARYPAASVRWRMERPSAGFAAMSPHFASKA